MAKASPEMLVIAKTYDLVLWSSERVAKFPRSHRFTLGAGSPVATCGGCAGA